MRIDNANGYIEEINEDKYLIFGDVFNEIVGKIREIEDDLFEYAKNYMKIKVNSDNLPLNKPLKFYHMTVTIRCVFSEDNRLYPQLFLDKALYS